MQVNGSSPDPQITTNGSQRHQCFVDLLFNVLSLLSFFLFSFILYFVNKKGLNQNVTQNIIV